jgi:hypothetical protein
MAVARQLPPFSVAAFECRLSDDDPRVDLQVHMPPVRVKFPGTSGADPVWDVLKIPNVDWAERHSRLHGHVSGAFLAFDLADRHPEMTEPSIFVALLRGTDSAAAVLDGISDLLPDSRGAADRLHRMAAELPAGAAIAGLGVMTGRQPPVVRVRLTGLQPDGLDSYLRAYGLQTRAAHDAVLGYTRSVDAVAVLADVDIGAPSIGFELFTDDHKPSFDRWVSLLQQLVNDGLCAPEKRDAVRRWPGAATRAPGDPPRHIELGDLLLAGRAESVFWRRVNHIKLSIAPGGEVAAKVYLAFGHRWIDRDRLREMAGRTR